MKSSKFRLYSNSSLYTGLVAGVVFSVVSLQNASANPQGATVVSGQVSVSQTGSNEIITQSTNTAIINWQSFNILSGQSTQFVQPSTNSVALNRITSGSASEILGSLSANGHLMIINPNGVIFGAGSTVNVAGLIASTADISNSNFNAGNYAFTTPGNPNASIVNKGVISAAEGGLVALVAPSVQNSGVINAHVGTVALGAAQTFTIDFYGDNLYSFALGTASTQTTSSALINSGAIHAKGGNVYLTARVAGSLVNDVINTTGIIDASASHKSKAGTIVIDGGDGNVNVAGNLNVSGKHKGQTGGSISVAGNNVTIASGANLDASGNSGGGTVSVTGTNSVYDALNSVINASAIESGNGGSVKLISANDTEFFGTILATGGASGGGGGTVETSGNYLNAAGVVDASAVNGNAGTWLLDPYNILINDGPDNNISGTSTLTADGSPSVVSVATITNELDTGTSVVITTNNAGGTEQGNIEVADTIAYTGNRKSSLTLDANGNIILDSGVSISSSNKALNVDLEAGGNITLSTNSAISSDGGAVTLNANTANAGGYVYLDSGSSITSGGGNITLSGTSGDVNFGGVMLGEYNGGGGPTLNAGGGNITIAGTATSLAGTEYDGVDIMGGSAISTTGSGTITITGYGSTAAGSPNNSVGVFINNSSVTAVNGDIKITGTGEINGNIPSFGVALDGATIATTGTGDITLTGTGTSGNAGIISGSDNYGTATIGGGSDKGNITLIADSLSLASETIQTNKTVTFEPLTAGTTVGLNDSGSALDITTALLGTVNAPTVTIGSAIAGELTANSFTYGSGLTTLNLISGNGISLDDATINTNGGNISLTGTSQTDSVAGVTINNSIINADPIAAPGGNITITGTGDALSTAGSNDGILVSGGTLETSGNGKITLTGTAGGTGASGGDTGVNLTSGSTLSVIDGNVNITGTGGNGNGWGEAGVHVAAGSTVTTSGKGSLNLTGFGGGTGSGTANDQGVSIDGTLTSTSSKNSAGGINLIGYSGDNNGSGQTNAGVVIFGGGSGGAIVSSVNGNIVIDGNTGLLGHTVSTVDGGSTSFPDAGIFVAGGSSISSTGSANITLNGVGANGSGLNEGVFLNNYFGGTTIKTTSGNITINGTAGNANSNGVSIIDGSDTVSTSGNGTINIAATGNLYDAGSVTSDLGSITLIGSNEDFESATVTTQGGNIAFNSLSGLFGGGYINVNNSLVTSDGGNITLGGGLFDLFAATSSTDGTAGITLTHDFLGAQGGNITITGAGDASGTAGSNDGVVANDATVISTTGGGTITITGFGGGASSSGNNFGVSLTDVGTGVSAQNGNITITGTGGNTTGSYDIGTAIQSGASVTSNGSGNINITGFGGGTGASTDDVGTVVAALGLNDGTGVFSTGTGNITLIGYTGDKNGNGVNTNYYDGGVYVNAPISSTGSGNILIEANTGLNSFLFPVSNTTGSGNYGITTYNATDISTTGTGTITLDGVAPGSSTGGNNIGVVLQNGAQVSTSGAGITINGTSGSGEDGVDIINGTLGNSSVSAGGTGTVGITALGGSDIFSAGAIASDSGNITFTGQNITLSGGTVTSTSGAVTADAVNNITVSNNNITTGNNGTTGGTITLAADTADANAGYVLLDDGTVVASNGGNITLSGKSGNTSIGGVSIGNYNDGSGATVNAGGGNITLTGTAAQAGTVLDGVDVLNGSTVSTTGAGTITLTGYGSTADDTGLSGDSNGVWLYNGSSVTSQNGNITIIGTAQGTALGAGAIPNYGILFENGTVATTGTGNITITGNGSNGADGVVSGNSYFGGSATIGGASDTGTILVNGNSLSLLSGSITTSNAITLSATGDVTVANNTITGGSVTVDPTNVSFSNTSVTTPGSGAIALNATNNIIIDNSTLTTGTAGGTGGNIVLTADTANANAGYVLVDGGSKITSNGGDITLSGASGDTSFGGVSIGNYHDGSSAQVNAGGGNITITGTAATGTTEFDGVDVLNGSQITTTGTGTITLTGYGSTGDSTNSGGDSAGVWLYNGSSVTAQNGAISITGTGQGTTSNIPNYGIVFENGTVANDGSGAITITGTGANGADGVVSGNSYFGGSATLGGASDTGTIFVTGNALSLLSGSITTSNAITLSATGDVTVANNSINGGSFTIDPTNASLSNTSVTTTGNGPILIDASNDITIDNTSLTTAGGKITLASNDTNSGAGAIVIEDGSSLTSKGGKITLGGGNTSGTGYAYGDSTETLTPYGGEAGISIDNSVVNAGSGDIFAKGIGGNNAQNVGVEITGSGQLITTSGDITITGKGGNTTGYGAYGVVLGSGGNITTHSGNIDITGTGASTSNGYGNGVQLYNSSSIITTYGNITLTGTAGGPESAYNFGLYSVAGDNIIGGSTDKGNITLNAGNNSSIDYINATITTAGNVTVDPTDFTLDASSMSGKNVTIDARNVSLLDDSTITAGEHRGDKLTINNTGVFYSDHDDVLNGYTITFNQNAGPNSSIQDAIDATGIYNSATLTLGKGSWSEDVNLDRSDFTLTGHGKDSIIKATGNNKTVLTIDDQHNDIVSDISFSSGGHKNVTGISIDPSSYITIADDNINVSGNGLTVSGGSHDTLVDNTISSTSGNGDGIKLSNVSDTLIEGDSIGGFKTGVNVKNGEYDTVKYNTITGTTDTAITVNGGRDITISHNTLNDVIGNGIEVFYSENDTIDDNKIEGASFGFFTLGNDGITLYDVSETSVNDNTISHFDTGIDVKNAQFVTLTHNHISDSTVAGINLNGGRNVTIADNTLKNVIGDGINVENSSNVSIHDNLIEAAICWCFSLGDNGITLSDVSDSTVTDNIIRHFNTGIDVKDSKYDSVKYNTIIGTAIAGISVDGGKGITVAKNFIHADKGDGIVIANSSDDAVYGNKITAATFFGYDLGNDGVKLYNVSDSSVDGNSISGFKTGVDVKDSKYDSIKGNRITGTTVAGISVDGGKDITIAWNTLKNIIGDGIDVANSSHDAIYGNWIEAAICWCFSLGDNGIQLSDVSDTFVGGNTIHDFRTGIDVTKHSDAIALLGNRIYGSTDAGINVDDSKFVGIAFNHIDAKKGDGIDVANSDAIGIFKNKITDGGTSGIELSDVAGALVLDNSISGFDTGIKIDDSSKYILVAKNDIDGSTKAGVSVDGGKDITVSHNTIKDAVGYGIVVANSSHDSIDDNTIEGKKYKHDLDGIKLSDVSDSSVDGNSISGFATGIDIKDSRYDSLKGNHITGTTVAGINVDPSSHITIADNLISHVSSGNGIEITGGSNDRITGNTITANIPLFLFPELDDGIVLNDVKDVIIGNGTKKGSNTIENFVTGIAVNDSRNVSIDKNTVSQIWTAGIAVNGSKNISITGNSLDAIVNDGIIVADSKDIIIDRNAISDLDILGYGAIGISLTNVSDTDIDDNRISKFLTGIKVVGGSHDTIYGNWIKTAISCWFGNLGDYGIKLVNVSDSSVDGNHISGFDTGIDVKGGSHDSVKYNHITGSTIAGINVDGGKDIKLVNNRIYAEAGDGIDVSNSSHDFIFGNWINTAANPDTGSIIIGSEGEGAGAGKVDSNTGDYGIKLSNVSDTTVNDNHIRNFATGIDIVHNSKFITVDGNKIKDSTIAGINVDDSSDITLADNRILVEKGDGIDVSNSSHDFIFGNWIKAASNDIIEDDFESDIESEGGSGDYGIKLSNVSDTKVNDNHIHNFATGIDVVNNSNHITIDGNHIKGSDVAGINVDKSSDFTIADNTITDGEGMGIDLSKDKGKIHIINNTINGFDIGVNVFKTNNVQFASNTITGFNGSFDLDIATGKITTSGGSVGVKVTDSDNVSFNGDSFIGNLIGLELLGSPNAKVENASFTDNTVGFLALDGKGKHHSSNEIVGDSTFDGDTLGVVLDGPYASMQFDATMPPSHFNGEAFYFVLVNGAMYGEVLNASQQYFEGNLAAEFSFGPYGELAQAEEKTIDSHNNFGVGTVFYRFDPLAFDGNQNADNFFNQLDDLFLGKPQFSYAGQTFGHFVPSLSIPEVNLSLLASGGGTVSFANLSPAAGGNSTPNSSNTVDYASLSPSAGGLDGCGNGFLGGGYSIGYNAGSCSAK